MTGASLSGNVELLAEEFWLGSRQGDQFPRPVEQAASVRLPLTIVPLRVVSVSRVRQWLLVRRLPVFLPDDGRDLMGCLIANRGHGIAFLCDADPPEERRLTAAHEIAHFLLDYLLPRRRVIGTLGPEALEIMDGDRPATLAERAAALLSHVNLGPHVHLLPRHGEDSNAPIAAAEYRADELALELVAPRSRLNALLRDELDKAAPGLPRPEATAALLGRSFGLPPTVFAPLLRRSLRPRTSPLLAAAFAAYRQERERESP